MHLCHLYACLTPATQKTKAKKSQDSGNKKERDSAPLQTTGLDVQFDTRSCSRKTTPLQKETRQRPGASTPRSSGRVEGNPQKTFFCASGPLFNGCLFQIAAGKRAVSFDCNEAHLPMKRRGKDGMAFRHCLSGESKTGLRRLRLRGPGGGISVGQSRFAREVRSSAIRWTWSSATTGSCVEGCQLQRG